MSTDRLLLGYGYPAGHLGAGQFVCCPGCIDEVRRVSKEPPTEPVYADPKSFSPYPGWNRCGRCGKTLAGVAKERAESGT